jgi:hypothetical protein
MPPDAAPNPRADAEPLEAAADEAIAACGGNARDSAWAMVNSFARGSEINERILLSATSKLAAWSREQKCRFYTRNHDATGATNKDRYKYLQRQIEQNFYPFYVTANAASKRLPRSSGPADLTPAQSSAATEPAQQQN